MIQLFKTALELMPSNNHKIVIRADKRPVRKHEIRFNAPTLNEVTIVLFGENMEFRDVVIQRRDVDNFKRMSKTHRSYDILYYNIPYYFAERKTDIIL